MTERLTKSFELLRTQKEPNPLYLPIPKSEWVLIAEDDCNYIFKESPILEGPFPECPAECSDENYKD